MYNDIPAMLLYDGVNYHIDKVDMIDRNDVIVHQPVIKNGFEIKCKHWHQGDWKIEDGKLYLYGMLGCYILKDNQPIHADWVSQDFLLVTEEGDSFIALRIVEGRLTAPFVYADNLEEFMERFNKQWAGRSNDLGTVFGDKNRIMIFERHDGKGYDFSLDKFNGGYILSDGKLYDNRN